MMANNADNMLSLNIVYFDSHFLVKGADIEVKLKEIINTYYLVKDTDTNVRSEENYLALQRMLSEDVMIVTVSLRSDQKMMITPCR